MLYGYVPNGIITSLTHTLTHTHTHTHTQKHTQPQTHTPTGKGDTSVCEHQRDARYVCDSKVRGRNIIATRLLVA